MSDCFKTPFFFFFFCLKEKSQIGWAGLKCSGQKLF